MRKIEIPLAYDNEAVHRQVKLLMMQGKELQILVKEEEVEIGCQGITGLRYLLNDNSWKWILGYLQTGDYEDFGVFPSAVARIAKEGDKEKKVKELIEQGYNVLPVRFRRETDAVISLRVIFKFGKMFFYIRRTDKFVDYLITQNKW
ncbi:MAG: hypothetical protein J6E48_00290 [Prevotella sp.]|nr:hypothetical protein [Prevotella sp.]